MNSSVAIVGLACLYPDARNPHELWENVLAQRRAFRRMPNERMRPEDYLRTDPEAPDCTYSVQVAVLEGYEFDRVAFNVAGRTYRSVDLAHWLALDVATRALADAGFPRGDGLPRESTGVLLGNTLTGEFSRAHVLRLRWPYVRRVLEACLAEQSWPLPSRREFCARLEALYKEPFPPLGEESLAGGLSNTIAGRICNQYDLKGGGYTIDGACAASLLAVANACSALIGGDLDVALAGGVDLSLDPFELVGFAKTGALAPQEMRVYDERSAGFWPGEGCGFAVLMREQDALAQGRRVYAILRGWGISSDGSGGITRPEVEGQLQALRRAYRRAGYGIDTVSFFEGHGTGTSVGDATEIRALVRARHEANPHVPQAALGSIKANIGHTKAAAGIAGVIKVATALYRQLLPPTTGCEKPHPELARQNALRVLNETELWPRDRPLRASVSAMGFGGINAHVTLEGASAERRTGLSPRERLLTESPQDAELFLLNAADGAALQQQVDQLLQFGARVSRAELIDLAAALSRKFSRSQVRAAIVAATPEQLVEGLLTLRDQLTSGGALFDSAAGVFFGSGETRPRIGFLFPGQGSPTHLDGGLYRRRFSCVRELYGARSPALPAENVPTRVAQPALARACLAALRVLNSLGIPGDVAVGHSLGEIVALHWAGAMDEAALLRIVTVRGEAMAELGSPTGRMVAIAGSAGDVAPLLLGGVSIVGYNSPRQTVIAGEAQAVLAVAARAQAKGMRAVKLPVSHAFHTSLVAAAAPVLSRQLGQERFQRLQRSIISTVTGAPLESNVELSALLCQQVVSPVQFLEALHAAAEQADLFIEVGPGQVLSGLVRDTLAAPVLPLDACGPSLRGLLQAAGATFVMGAPLQAQALFADRFVRPFNLDWKPRFFVNPCELAPLPKPDQDQEMGTAHFETELSPPIRSEGRPTGETPAALLTRESAAVGVRDAGSRGLAAMDVVRQLVAQRTELPVSAIHEAARMLSDLHLNSITVGQMVAEAARRVGIAPPLGVTEFANATVAEIARALDELASTGAKAGAVRTKVVPGVEAWFRAFTVELIPEPLEPPPAPDRSSRWQVIAPEGYSWTEILAQQFRQMLPHSVVSSADPLPSPLFNVIVCLPPLPNEAHLALLVKAAQAALDQRNECKFVLVQHGKGAAGFARTLHLEAPRITVCVVNVPSGHPQAAEWVVLEALAAHGYREAHYDSSGVRREPRLQLLSTCGSFEGGKRSVLSADDVLLVTGGGKGIAAECALALGRSTGARLVLLGRSRPEGDAELSANLERMAATGVRCRYFAADVTDAAAVRQALSLAQKEFGAITAILHGAGSNVPRLISALDERSFRRTLAPKVRGLENVLAAVDAERLRLLMTFGSIIARTGLPGEADYALANEWQTFLTEQFQAAHPHCRCLAAEWSVWSGVGMGQRLGRVESLLQQGITPLPPDQGVAWLSGLLEQSLPSVAVVVSGRFGEIPTLVMEKPELPLWRFLERPLVFYPGIELIAEAELSPESDPYLSDHTYAGEQLFPAVLGLEAMAQLAMALTGSSRPPRFENVQWSRPIVVPRDRKCAIRIAAVLRESGELAVVLRSEETAFQVDHFAATCWCEKTGSPMPNHLNSAVPRLKSPIALDPQRDLYGDLLFHTGRFQRVRNYHLLRARECLVELASDTGAAWFGQYLPSQRVLGDPGVRDAAIHAIQACIPYARLLPVAVQRVIVGDLPCMRTSAPVGAPRLFLHAREQARDKQTFHYDLALLSDTGEVFECWEGLQLRQIEPLPRRNPWTVALLSPYLERHLEECFPATRLSVVLEANALPDRSVKTSLALQRLLAGAVTIRHRPDGKPEISGELTVSTAHTRELTLAVAGPSPLGADLETVTARSDSAWQDLLGPDRLALAETLRRESGEDQDKAATRVWLALECLKKAGLALDTPLAITPGATDGWTMFRSGAVMIASTVLSVRELSSPIALAVLARGRD